MPEEKFCLVGLSLNWAPRSKWPEVTVHSDTEDGSDVTDDMIWTAFAEQFPDVWTAFAERFPDVAQSDARLAAFEQWVMGVVDFICKPENQHLLESKEFTEVAISWTEVSEHEVEN